MLITFKHRFVNKLFAKQLIFFIIIENSKSLFNNFNKIFSFICNINVLSKEFKNISSIKIKRIIIFNIEMFNINNNRNRLNLELYHQG